MQDKKLNIPNHIAIIMDGNGRWASKSNLPKKAGHKKGGEVAKQIVSQCKRIGVNYLTLFTFSSENWNRSESEIKDLMNLLRHYLKSHIKDLIKQDVKIKFIGRRDNLERDIQKSMLQAEEKSKHNKFNLILAISYGARDELRDAAESYFMHRTNNLDNNDIKLEDFLYTKGIPDPDLLIRTSGEQRISNYLLWQLAYAELYFTEVLWPDFNESCLMNAIEEFSNRDRRYGRR